MLMQDAKHVRKGKIVLYEGYRNNIHTAAVGQQHVAHTDNVARKINICFSSWIEPSLEIVS